jgi:hypothetical protein
MANVFVAGRHEGTAVEDYEDHVDHVRHINKTLADAIAWAKKEGHKPLVALVKPGHWREASQNVP